MIYFTSDLHFYHAKVIEYSARPFANVEEMNEALINNWNSCVKPDDHVYILGDFFFCGTKKIVEIMSRLNGKKTLVTGNHDWRNIKPHRLDLGFLQILDPRNCDYRNIIFTLSNKQQVALSHFPYCADHPDLGPRYLDFRPADNGLVLLHGHIHTLWKTSGRQINVGCDVWDFKPVSEEEIIRQISAMPEVADKEPND